MLWETELGNARVKGTLHGSVVQLEGVLCVCVCVCVCLCVCVCMCDHVLPHPSMGPGNSAPIVSIASYNVF